MSVHNRDDVVVFAPRGRIDHKSDKEFEARLQPYVDACGDGSGAMILDLVGVSYISSVGLRVLMVAHKATRGRCGTIVLCRPSPDVSEILHISSFDKVTKVYDSLESALVGVGTGAPTAG